MRNEAARGAEILSDATAGGAAGAMFGGLLGYGITDQVLRDVMNGSDSILRLIAKNPKVRRGAALAAGLAAAGVGGVAGSVAAGGGRWVHGSPRPKTAMKLPNVKPKTIFGMSQGADRKAGIVSAALPKMRVPSGLAADQMRPPKIKIGAAMNFHVVCGFLKEASLTEYGRKRSEGYARAFGQYSDDLEAVQREHGLGVGDRSDRALGKLIARRQAWNSERKGLGNLKRLNPFGGLGRGGEEALKRVRSKAASTERDEGVFSARARVFDGMARTHRRLNREHPVQGVLRDLGAESSNRRGSHVAARISNLRARGDKGGRWSSVFNARPEDFEEFKRRKSASGAEHQGGFEAHTGELDTGKPLADSLRGLIRSDDPTESSGVITDQGAYRRFHGHSGGGDSGRP